MNDTKKLTPRTAKLIDDEGNDTFVSAVGIWEIEIQFPLTERTGAPPFSSAVARMSFRAAGFRILDITARRAIEVEALPPIHGDPHDRMLVARAVSEPPRFLTADAILRGYGELVISN